MLRILNSLQFRLLLIFVVLVGLLVAWNVTNVQSIERLDKSGEHIELASLQRSNAYLLSSLTQRLTAAEEETQQATIENFITQTIANVDEIQNVLRSGNAETERIDNPAVLTLLDEVDAEWIDYRSNLQEFLNAPDEERGSYLASIDQRSVTFFTFSDRLVGALQALQGQNRASDQWIYNVVLTVGIVTTLFVMALIIQIAYTVRDLGRQLQIFADGDLETRARTYNIRELNNIGQVFNHMADRLQSLIGNLNERVKEATAELSDQVKEAQSARETAEKSDQVKSAFLASMSHELRTPLNAVINLTKFVAQGDLGPVNEDQRDTLMESVDSARHLLSLINDVLDMSKIESGSLNLFVQDNINVATIISFAISTARTLIGVKPVEIYTNIAPGLPRMRGDEQRIRQILLNILANAVKFTEKGHIEVRATKEDDRIIIAIADTGPGIPKEDHAAVFEPFKQTDSGLRKGGGTGLGMPITKNLVEIHGGQLWLESESGKGSTFFVALPIRSNELVPVI
ncbi:MAG: ATP-binding protein [Chloroflexi bacterium]|nr:ATP-binding protein [Chloroflexota bacterium]